MKTNIITITVLYVHQLLNRCMILNAHLIIAGMFIQIYRHMIIDPGSGALSCAPFPVHVGGRRGN